MAPASSEFSRQRLRIEILRFLLIVGFWFIAFCQTASRQLLQFGGEPRIVLKQPVEIARLQDQQLSLGYGYNIGDPLATAEDAHFAEKFARCQVK